MKKIYFFALLTLVGLGACQTKTPPQNSDTAKGGGSTMIPSSQIMPPISAANPIIVSTQAGLNPDSITIIAIFNGPDSQAVTINTGAGGMPSSFNSKAKSFGVMRMLAPSSPKVVTISSTDTGKSYSSVTNTPLQIGPNMVGIDVTRLTTSSDTVVIIVQDDALSIP